MSASGPQLLVATADRVRGRLRRGGLVPAVPGAPQHVLVRRLPRRARHGGADPARAPGWWPRHDGHPAAARPLDVEHRAHAGRPLRGRRPRRQGPRTGRRAGRPDRRRCRSGRSCARRCCAASAPSNRWPPPSGWSRSSTSGISEVDYGAVDRPQDRRPGQGAAVGGGAAAAQRRGVPRRRRAWRRCRPARWRRSASTTAGSPSEHGGDVLWVACTHGDVIKAVVADALGTHLDSFQRITADPASMSVIRYTALRPFVIHVNHTGADSDRGTAGQAAREGPPRTARCRRRRRGRRLDRLTVAPQNYG